MRDGCARHAPSRRKRTNAARCALIRAASGASSAPAGAR
ncbi:hypothetical protein BURPSS13_C0102 [Burkholderia pseudomallei S13]|nr:hypothetical protein BURPSS13_C0102 [Burkholderia pseudomallei S13]